MSSNKEKVNIKVRSMSERSSHTLAQKKGGIDYQVNNLEENSS